MPVKRGGTTMHLRARSSALCAHADAHRHLCLRRSPAAAAARLLLLQLFLPLTHSHSTFTMHLMYCEVCTKYTLKVHVTTMSTGSGAAERHGQTG